PFRPRTPTNADFVPAFTVRTTRTDEPAKNPQRGFIGRTNTPSSDRGAKNRGGGAIPKNFLFSHMGNKSKALSFPRRHVPARSARPALARFARQPSYSQRRCASPTRALLGRHVCAFTHVKGRQALVLPAFPVPTCTWLAPGSTLVPIRAPGSPFDQCLGR